MAYHGAMPRHSAKKSEGQAPAGERLSKRVMALQGCSRSEAEHYIEGGFVSVNGRVIEAPQHRVNEESVTIDPRASLLQRAEVTLLLHTPALHLQPGALLGPQTHWPQDASETRVLQRHFAGLSACAPLESAASGLVVYTQDWRIQRKLEEDAAVIEHELMLEVTGAIEPDALAPLERLLKDPTKGLPSAKISVSSSTEARSRLRLAVKGAHPGFAAYLCERARLELLALRRIRLGRVALADLPVGQWRFLAPAERF